MTVDTASSVSIIGEFKYRKYLKKFPLQETDVKITSYTGHPVNVIGYIEVPVTYEETRKNLQLIVTKGNKASLLGRDWMKHLTLNWKRIFEVNQLQLPKQNQNALEKLLEKYSCVFGTDYGEIKDFRAHIVVKEGTVPIFKKSRHVPYALSDAVNKELTRLEDNGIYVRTDRSDWASPIVVVPKADSKIRLCGDYKVSINKSVEDQPYPLPTADDIFSRLAGGKLFTKIDLSQAFTQLVVDEHSRKYLTVNTPKGLFVPTRLPFGVKTAPHIFQSVMDQILLNLPGTCCYIDDILISGSSEREHLLRLEEVLRRLQLYGIRAKREKCSFMLEAVEYPGHVINEEGIHPQYDKVEAIKEAKVPENTKVLRQLLGLINYYRKFLPDLSTTLAPLNKLLQDKVQWEWSKDCEEALTSVKNQICSDNVLVHYDPNKELIMACDASPFGVGAVLSHIVEGEERPIAFASRTLTTAEQGYAQLEKEALGIIFGIKKFHKYLYGRKFKLVTDNKPLSTIIGPHKDIPTLAAVRLQRWALILMSYNYEVVCKKSNDHGNADYVSRTPHGQAKRNLELEVNYFSNVRSLPVTAGEISSTTQKDPLLSRVYDFTLNGWPEHLPSEDMKPYHKRRMELSCDQGCLLFGMRVVIPAEFQQHLLNELHSEHFGIVRTKAIARSYMWFPDIEEAIENMINSCEVCQALQKDPPSSPLQPWTYPEYPWTRIHIDFGEYRGQSYLIVVDSFSKWIEVIPMSSTTSHATIEELQKLFCQHGIPKELVSDNGPQLTSEAFENFLEKNGVKHILTPPYHPSSNGQVERYVQTVKTYLKKQALKLHEECSSN